MEGCDQGQVRPWRHLALSCSVHGQDGPLPRRATVSPAPLSPHATRSESMAPQILRLGPPSSDPKIQPAGASGKVRCPQIGWHACDRCFGGLSRRAHGSGQSNQRSTCASADPLSAYAGASFAAGGCAPVCRPRHVRRAARDSGFRVFRVCSSLQKRQTD